MTIYSLIKKEAALFTLLVPYISKYRIERLQKSRPFCDDTLTFYTDIFLLYFKLLSCCILVLAHSERYLTS